MHSDSFVYVGTEYIISISITVGAYSTAEYTAGELTDC